MPEPSITPISFTYTKPDKDISLLNHKDIPIPEHRIIDRAIVQIGKNTIAGNHTHSRTEWFVGLGEHLEFYWVDEKGNVQQVHMNPDNELFLIEVPPYLPHAVKNAGDSRGYLIEFSDQKPGDVQKVSVI